MAQDIFSNPYVSSAPALTGASVGDGTLTIDRLTHFTINQDYTAVCTAIAPFTVFKIIGSLDGSVGVAVVGDQFYDQDLKVYLTIEQGPTLFQVGDTFEFSVAQGVDLNRENIDLYDEKPQKNFGAGVAGQLSGDHNLRFTLNSTDASLELQDLSFVSILPEKLDGNEISIRYIEGSILAAAYLIEQDLTYTAANQGAAGNDISIEYVPHTDAINASRVIQDLNYSAIAPGADGNNYNINYVGGATQGNEVASILGYDIQVTIEDGVSTVNDIGAALLAVPAIVAVISAGATGTGLEPQSVTGGGVFLQGGQDAIGLAGSEVVDVVGNAISITFEDGVSTAQQIYDAILLSAPALALITPTISGTALTPQTNPFGPTNLANGADDVGNPGNEIVQVLDEYQIQITFVSGASTAQQVHDALVAVTAVTDIVNVGVSGVAGSHQNSNISKTYLKGGRNLQCYAFNTEELTDPEAFYEGNASILVKDVIAQGELLVVKDAKFNQNVEIDENLQVDGDTTLNGNLNLNDPDSGDSISNVQESINNLIQNGKVFIYTVDDEKVEWSNPAGTLTFNDDLKINFSNTGFINTILAADGPWVIADGEHFYVQVDRTQNANLTPIISTSVPSGLNYFRLVSRVGDSLIWWDNTLQRVGKSLRIGEGGSSGAYQELLGTGNGVNDTFSIGSGLIPVSQESILVFANAHSYVTTEWTYDINSNSIIFDTPPEVGVQVYIYFLTDGEQIAAPSGGGLLYSYVHTVTAGEINDDELSLVIIPPDPSKMLVDIVGGGPIVYNQEFTIDGALFQWGGYTIDGVLAAGDQIRFHYFA